MKLEYYVVDVFTDTPLEGNPLAVFPSAEGVDSTTMQRIAREMNLSETTFVTSPIDPSHDAVVKIFTPTYEMNFAGHPTIGTAHVLRSVGMVPADRDTLVLKENVGPVPVRVDGASGESDPVLWLTTPAIKFEGRYDSQQCAHSLGLKTDDLADGIPCELWTAGNPCVFVPLKSADAVDRAKLDTPALSELFASRNSPTCIFPFAATPSGAYSRMFAPELGIIEDPATGSVTGPLAAFMMKYGLADSADGTRFVSEQGTKMGRRSLLHVYAHGKGGERGIEVGGRVAPFASGGVDIKSFALVN